MCKKNRSQQGVSLLEVLAAIFVVSIGLLGVLAVIPFGAYQVSRARHAEYASNMLANAAEEIFIREMANPMEWTADVADALTVESGGILVFTRKDTPSESTLNCTRFIWYEPAEVYDPEFHVFCVSTFITAKKWDEVMRGQDDLDYTASTGKRPELKFNNDGTPQSLGKYTWFFTYLPTTSENPKSAVPLANVDSPVAIDVLACYNRVASDDRQVQPSAFVPSQGGGTFTFPDAAHLELLTQTKYVFVTWGTLTQVEGGAWCKIVFLDKSNPKVAVTGNLDAISGDIQVYIPSGVLYHKRLENVPIK